MNISEILSRFPALWVVIGGLIVGGIGYIIARKAFTISAAAQDRLINILQGSVKTLEKERDEYRETSHTYRNECHALGLKLKEAESRPDLTKLFEAQQKEADRRYEVYTQQTELIARQSEVLSGVAKMQERLVADFGAHEDANAARQDSITRLLSEVVDRLQKQLPRKNRKQV